MATTTNDKPVVVTAATFDSDVLGASEPVLVDFWAAWCGPCRMIAPTVEEIASEHAGRLKVAKLDVDNHPELAHRYEVLGLPTLILFKGGKPVERFVGFAPKSRLMAGITPHLS